MVRIDQKVMLQLPKVFLEIGYGLLGVFGKFFIKEITWSNLLFGFQTYVIYSTPLVKLS